MGFSLRHLSLSLFLFDLLLLLGSRHTYTNAGEWPSPVFAIDWSFIRQSSQHLYMCVRNLKEDERSSCDWWLLKLTCWFCISQSQLCLVFANAWGHQFFFLIAFALGDLACTHICSTFQENKAQSLAVHRKTMYSIIISVHKRIIKHTFWVNPVSLVLHSTANKLNKDSLDCILKMLLLLVSSVYLVTHLCRSSLSL